MHVLVAGCGWLGRAVATQLLARGDRVTAVRSSEAGAAELRALGIPALALDLSRAETAQALPADLEAILALQAARGGGAEAYRQAYLASNATLLAAARSRPVRALVHSGSTGIFGQSDGAELDEHSQPQPVTATGAVLAEAEALLRAGHQQGLPVRLVRLSGLYGPGRWWPLDRVRAGLMGLGRGDGAWLNACHQEDAVAVLLAALDRGRDGAVYHGTDAEPIRRRDLVRWLAAGLGQVPARVDLASDDMGRRISGRWTRDELSLTLRWPSLREGLRPVLAEACRAGTRMLG